MAKDTSVEDSFQVLITAEQAWPAFERRVLAAQIEVTAGFRIFDLATPLKSPQARAIGTDWWDLLAHALRRGVRIRLVISDFDPVFGTSLHETTWRTMRQAAALAEYAQPAPGQLQIIPAMHPARVGVLARAALWPAVIPKLRAKLREVRGIRRARQAVRLDEGSWPELHAVTHHQKLAVIDREWLYIGGLDLNPRRDDSLSHDRPAAQTWADVQLLVRGPEAVEAKAHLDDFLDVTSGQAPARPGNMIRRTLSAPRRVAAPFVSPRTLLCEIERDHVAAIKAAKSLIYIETQFLRSGRITDALVWAAQDRPGLRLIVVLPSLPDDVAFEGARSIDARYGMALQARAIGRVRAAFGARVTIATPVQPVDASGDAPWMLQGSPVVHVHSKALVVDDSFAMVGSANLNGRSMRWDTEAALKITEPARIKAVREALLSHWWFDALPPEARDPAQAQQWWDKQVRFNAARRSEARLGFLVPHDAERLPDHHQPLPGVTENMV